MEVRILKQRMQMQTPKDSRRRQRTDKKEGGQHRVAVKSGDLTGAVGDRGLPVFIGDSRVGPRSGWWQEERRGICHKTETRGPGCQWVGDKILQVTPAIQLLLNILLPSQGYYDACLS